MSNTFVTQEKITYLFRIIATPRQNGGDFITLLLNKNGTLFRAFLDVDEEDVREVLGSWDALEYDQDPLVRPNFVTLTTQICDLDKEDCRKIANKFHHRAELDCKFAKIVKKRKRATVHSKKFVSRYLLATDYKKTNTMQNTFCEKTYKSWYGLISKDLNLPMPIVKLGGVFKSGTHLYTDARTKHEAETKIAEITGFYVEAKVASWADPFLQ